MTLRIVVAQLSAAAFIFACPGQAEMIYSTYDGTNAASGAFTVLDYAGFNYAFAGSNFSVGTDDYALSHVVLNLSRFAGDSTNLWIVFATANHDPIARLVSDVPVSDRENYTFSPTQTILFAASTLYEVYLEAAPSGDTYFFWHDGTAEDGGMDFRENNGPWDSVQSFRTGSLQVFANIVPEPSTLFLVIVGWVGAFCKRRFRISPM